MDNNNNNNPPIQHDITILIQDLLSNSNTKLPSNILNLISFHLSNSNYNNNLNSNNGGNSILSNLVTYIVTSPSLWNGNSLPNQDDKTTRKWNKLNFNYSLEIYNSILNGILFRSILIKKEFNSTGFTARREFILFLNQFYLSLNLNLNSNTKQEINPIIKLIIISACLNSLQILKQRKDKLFIGGKNLLGRAEFELLKSWEEFFKEFNQSMDSDDILPTWLAIQVLPTFTTTTLSTGPISSIISLLLSSFNTIFNQGHLFSTLSSDLSHTSSTPPLLKWNVPSPSHTSLLNLSTSPLFLNLGLLSRSIGRSLEALSILSSKKSIKGTTGIETETEIEKSILSVNNDLLKITERIQRDWSQCIWSEILIEIELEEETRKINLPFKILKSLLFSIVLIQSSYLTLLSPTSSSLSSSFSSLSTLTINKTTLKNLYLTNSKKPTSLQINLSRSGLKILGMTYFIANKFGTEGFGAWNGVLVGLIEVVGLGGEIESERLMKELEVNRLDVIHEREVERSEVTFYLNVAEQLMKSLGNDYVESKVLLCCHPYLEDPKYRDTFESAHSVLLAIFASEKKCANELAPWYTRLLLSAYPNLMTASQLRLAFTTMIKCISTTDDALAWYCILQLISTIQSIPITTSRTTSTSTDNSTSNESNSTTSRTFNEEEPTTRLSEIINLSPLEESVLKLERGHLLLTLIDQLSSINLILLRNLLEKIWEFIKLEDVIPGDGEVGEGREALMKVIFNTLGEGLDDTKRDEGVRFWLERGEELAL